ncbi:hypothetical protein M9H77_23833 [Catharanthus roseus]|uniref:Uncharacterized protein n=1 Tax=Catharanthus roseus TaxID=4058 RepID=A0ACC0AUF5_CATRO|nr:hypothetical protein M9H77_23833 [Catharanthus roseus]
MLSSWSNIRDFFSFVLRSASTLAKTFTFPAAASTLPGMSTLPTAASTPLATLTPLQQLPYLSLAPTSTPSASSAEGLSSRPIPSSSACPPAPAASSAASLAPSSQGVVDSLILILQTADSFDKQSDSAKVITEIMKAHFVEVYPSFGKVPDRMKNMWYTKFRVIFMMNGAWRHTRRGGRWYSRTGCRGMVARGLTSTPAGLAGEDGQGLFTIRTVCPTSSAEGTVGRYTIRPVLSEVNGECLHIETGLPIKTDE